MPHGPEIGARSRSLSARPCKRTAGPLWGVAPRTEVQRSDIEAQAGPTHADNPDCAVTEPPGN